MRIANDQFRFAQSSFGLPTSSQIRTYIQPSRTVSVLSHRPASKVEIFTYSVCARYIYVHISLTPFHANTSTFTLSPVHLANPFNVQCYKYKLHCAQTQASWPHHTTFAFFAFFARQSPILHSIRATLGQLKTV